MPATKTYEYHAVDTKGLRTKGRLDAATESAAAQAVRSLGVTPLYIGEAGKGLRGEITIPGLSKRVTLKHLAIFARQFATMTASGLTLLRSLAVLEEQAERPALAKAIGAVRADIESGLSLSGALARQDKVFPRLMVAMIRAGEAGGFLDEALHRIATTFEKDAHLRSKIKSALTYPTIVLCSSLVLIVAVLLFIVPIFEGMFAQLGGTLPLPTRIVVFASDQMWWAAPLLLALAITGAIAVRRKINENDDWRLAVDRIKLRLPIFGKLYTKVAVSRFARNLGTLLSVGVPIIQALDVVSATTGNAVLAEATKDISLSVRDGRSMSAPLADHPVFPPMVRQMVEVGEETGQISAMLEKVADFYDHEVDVATEALTAAIEPIMVVVMAAIVGALVICLYLPMFTIYQHVQGAR